MNSTSQAVATQAAARHPLHGDAAGHISGECTASVPTKAELGEQIVAIVNRADSLLKAAIRLPEGHEWSVSANRLNFGGGPVDSSEHGVSLHIRKKFDVSIDNATRSNDPDQVNVEIRMFFPKAEYATKKGTRTFRAHGDTTYDAILWVQSGPQWAGQSTDHTSDAERYPKGESLEDFVATVAAAVNSALMRACPGRLAPEAKPTTSMTEEQHAAEVSRLLGLIKLHDDGKKNPKKALAQKIEHNRERNRLQEELRQLRLNYHTLVS
ncbi:hypothetical protein [Paraburkholderia sp. SIMBA_054]|uniref:hypothetical protein n=1 Tax=Paraburkholderia sp. SIMBA_054 TaxID=3085795 RepID=UPI00397C73D7